MAERYDLKEKFRSLLSAGEDTTALEAVRILTTKDGSLALKTEISDPMRLSIFSQLSSYLKRKGMTISAKLMKDIHDTFLVNMVSKNRKSRQEVIEALKALAEREKEKGLTERLIERQK